MLIQDIIFFVATTVAFIIVVVFLLPKRPKTSQRKIKNTGPQSSYVITSHDIKAIAGDDVMTTQLDLARAYIEMHKTTLAKQILVHVIEHGDADQQQEARQLLIGLT